MEINDETRCRWQKEVEEGASGGKPWRKVKPVVESSGGRRCRWWKAMVEHSASSRKQQQKEVQFPVLKKKRACICCFTRVLFHFFLETSWALVLFSHVPRSVVNKVLFFLHFSVVGGTLFCRSVSYSLI